jgi:signal-transduction protein with cAMP-binding, CBS, and nucleotidyltransferase domain
MVMLLRVLALYAGDASGGSVQRIQLLQEKGFLDVELAQRLLQAYQCIMQLKVLLEIRGEEAGLYCSPQDFSTETETRFRNALDAVQSLQKIGYQRLVGG